VTSPESFYDTPLSREEFDARLKDALAEMDGPGGAEISDYIEWFLRRYPTPLARLKYARRKYAEAMRTRGLARRE
jgi:hypothetical protein